MTLTSYSLPCYHPIYHTFTSMRGHLCAVLPRFLAIQFPSSGHKVQIDPSMSSEIKSFFRPTSSRSEYVPTQSEYRLAQKEIAADVMHTLGKYKSLRNEPA